MKTGQDTKARVSGDASARKPWHKGQLTRIYQTAATIDKTRAGFFAGVVAYASSLSVLISPLAGPLYLCVAAGLTAGIGYAKKFYQEYLRKGGEPLTTGETAYVRAIFGDEIDPAIIRKHVYKQENPKACAFVTRPNRKNIDFPHPSYHSDDYSQEMGKHKFGTFIHEVTHLHQNKTEGPLKSLFNFRTRAYEYDLTESSRYETYGREQQASIIQHYCMRFLNPEFHKPPQTALSPHNKNLQRVVEERFPAARQTRKQFEASGRSPAFFTTAVTGYPVSSDNTNGGTTPVCKASARPA